jgi:hypothetical protein
MRKAGFSNLHEPGFALKRDRGKLRKRKAASTDDLNRTRNANGRQQTMLKTRFFNAQQLRVALKRNQEDLTWLVQVASETRLAKSLHRTRNAN